MPSIKLTDQFGLDVDAEPADGSALLKYFQQLRALRLDSIDFKQAGGLTLDQPALQSLQTGVSFKEPVSLGEGGPGLTIGAGVHGSLRIVRDADDLPGRGDSEFSADCSYVAFALDASASVNVSTAAAGITFGAAPSTDLKFTTCSRFPNQPGISLLDAVRQTVGAMAIPAKADDLAGLAPGQIAAVDVTGKWKLSGSADLFAASNPLATLSLPGPLPAVGVSAGGSATVGVSLAIETDYQVVAQKLDSGAVRLGWYNKRSATLSFDAKVSGGVSTEVGGTDIFSAVIGAISSDAKADLDELTRAGLAKEEAESIQDAVKAAVCRKLEIAAAAALSTGESKAAAFLFEIRPGELSPAARAAIDQALGGDLSALHDAALPGVTAVHSIWEHVRKRGLELNVNLLGIVNYGSVAKLALAGKVLYEPASGALVITDKATAARVQSTAVNFGADTAKLRHVLAESFLLTAAYQGTRALAGEASLRCSHTFFTLQQQTSPREIGRDLRTGLALGLLTIGETEPPAGIEDFGRTLFTAAADYNSDLVNRMFLDSTGSALAREVYENAGRAAIQFLVHQDDEDAIRRQPAIDNVLWQHMKDTGQPGIPALFNGVAAPLAGAIVADYSTIQWWAEAMSGMAKQLADFRRWQADHPDAGPDDAEFQKRRADLAQHLRDVAANTREEFGAPWGLIAMSQLTDQRSGARLLLTGPRLAIDKRRALAAGAGT